MEGRLSSQLGPIWQVVLTEAEIVEIAKWMHEGVFRAGQALRMVAAKLLPSCSCCRNGQRLPWATELSIGRGPGTMDFLTVGLFQGYMYLLDGVDHFTKLAVAVPIRDQTAQTAVAALWKRFILIYGYPTQLHSDQGACFEGKVIEELC